MPFPLFIFVFYSEHQYFSEITDIEIVHRAAEIKVVRRLYGRFGLFGYRNAAHILLVPYKIFYIGCAVTVNVTAVFEIIKQRAIIIINRNVARTDSGKSYLNGIEKTLRRNIKADNIMVSARRGACF